MLAYAEQAKHAVSELGRLRAAGGDRKQKLVVVFLAASGGDGAKALHAELGRSPTLSADDVTVLCSDLIPGQDPSSGIRIDGLDGHGHSPYERGSADIVIGESAYFNSELTSIQVEDMMRLLKPGGLLLLWMHHQHVQNMTPWDFASAERWRLARRGTLCARQRRA